MSIEIRFSPNSKRQDQEHLYEWLLTQGLAEQLAEAGGGDIQLNLKRGVSIGGFARSRKSAPAGPKRKRQAKKD